MVAAVINRIDNPCCMVGNECRIRAMTVIILRRTANRVNSLTESLALSCCRLQNTCIDKVGQ